MVATLSIFVQNQVLAFFLPFISILFMFVVANFFCLRKDIEIENEDEEDDPAAKLIKKGSLILTVLILIGSGVMVFSGDVSVEVNDKSLRVSGFMSSSTFIDYDDIESVEIADKIESSSRVGGFGGFKVSTGNFLNDEFGKYKRYTYNDLDTYVVIKTKDKYVVFNMSNEKDTEKYYERILEKCSHLLS